MSVVLLLARGPAPVGVEGELPLPRDEREEQGHLEDRLLRALPVRALRVVHHGVDATLGLARVEEVWIAAKSRECPDDRRVVPSASVVEERFETFTAALHRSGDVVHVRLIVGTPLLAKILNDTLRVPVGPRRVG